MPWISDVYNVWMFFLAMAILSAPVVRRGSHALRLMCFWMRSSIICWPNLDSSTFSQFCCQWCPVCSGFSMNIHPIYHPFPSLTNLSVLKNLDHVTPWCARLNQVPEGFALLGPPCGLFVFISAAYHQRSWEFPYGNQSKKKIRGSNQLVINLLVLLAVAHCRHVYFLFLGFIFKTHVIFVWGNFHRVWKPVVNRIFQIQLQMTGWNNLGAVYYGYSLRWPDFWIWFKLQECIRGCAALDMPYRNQQCSCQTSKMKLLVLYYVDSGVLKWRNCGKKYWVQNWCLFWPFESYGSTSPRDGRQHWSFIGIEKSNWPSTKSVSTESTDPRATTENSFQEGNIWKILGSTLQVFARLFLMSGRQLTIQIPENLLGKIYLWKICGGTHSQRAPVKRTNCGKKCFKKTCGFFPKGFCRNM